MHASRILDVGCGAGALGEMIKQRQHAVVYGIEIDDAAACKAKERLDYVWQVTVEQALPEISDSSLDVIIAADVLEHLVNPWKVLSEIYRKLVPGGRVVASVPNIQHWTLLRQLLEGYWEYQSDGILDYTHLRFFTKRSIEELFWSAGFAISKLEATHRYGRIPPRFRNALKRIVVHARELEDSCSAYQYLVVGDKRLPVQQEPKIAVVILNWNGKDDTVECLQSLTGLDYANYEVIVVDNGSADGSVNVIRSRFPTIPIIETKSNLGYAGGNNVGIRRALDAGAEYLLLLNNDTTVDPQLLSALVGAAQTCGDEAIFSPKIYFHADPRRIWYAGGHWQADRSRFSHVGYGKVDVARDFTVLRETDYASGCALFASAKVFAKVGLLDESFFLTFEETDFCYRARREGIRCFVVPAAKVWHRVSRSFGGAGAPLVRYFMTRNRLLWGRKHLSTVEFVRLCGAMYRELFPRLALDAQTGRSHLKQLYWGVAQFCRELRKRLATKEFKASLYGVRDFVLGRFGYPEATIRKLK
jgi:methionine biosynthesis protein MetW